MALLSPKRTRYRKAHRGRRKGLATRGEKVAFGDYGLQALEPAWISARQIESCRTTIVRQIERNSKVWIRIFPDKPITKKPADSRMGKGKGDVDHWAAVVKTGRVLFEMSGITHKRATRIAQLVSYKLPIKIRLLERRLLGGER